MRNKIRIGIGFILFLVVCSFDHAQDDCKGKAKLFVKSTNNEEGLNIRLSMIRDTIDLLVHDDSVFVRNFNDIQLFFTLNNRKLEEKSISQSLPLGNLVYQKKIDKRNKNVLVKLDNTLPRSTSVDVYICEFKFSTSTMEIFDVVYYDGYQRKEICVVNL